MNKLKHRITHEHIDQVICEANRMNIRAALSDGDLFVEGCKQAAKLLKETALFMEEYLDGENTNDQA